MFARLSVQGVQGCPHSGKEKAWSTENTCARCLDGSCFVFVGCQPPFTPSFSVTLHWILPWTRRGRGHHRDSPAVVRAACFGGRYREFAMLGTRWLGRYRFRLPLIASILYLLFAGLAYGTMYLVESSGGRFVVGIQNLIFRTFYLSSQPWMWALDFLGLVSDYIRFPTPLGLVLAHIWNTILIFTIGLLIVKIRKSN